MLWLELQDFTLTSDSAHILLSLRKDGMVKVEIHFDHGSIEPNLRHHNQHSSKTSDGLKLKSIPA